MIKFFKRKKENSINVTPAEETQPVVLADEAEDMNELIAVITAAVAVSLNRTTHNIIVRSVIRIPTVSPAWNRAARLDLTASKLY